MPKGGMRVTRRRRAPPPRNRGWWDATAGVKYRGSLAPGHIDRRERLKPASDVCSASVARLTAYAGARVTDTHNHPKEHELRNYRQFRIAHLEPKFGS